MSNDLIRDNLLLSRPNFTDRFAINCTNHLPPEVAQYIEGSLAWNTKRAYQSDLKHFQNWGGSVPSTDVQVASYLAAHAKTHSIATLRRHLASIAKAHATRRLTDTLQSSLIAICATCIGKPSSLQSHHSNNNKK